MSPKAEEPDAGARRAKKREVDRRAQRASRERTRNRIAYLEAALQAVTRQDSSSFVACLMEQLADMTRQRDDLSRTLSSIESTVHAHRKAEEAATTVTTTNPGGHDHDHDQWPGSRDNMADMSLMSADEMAMDLLTPGGIIDLPSTITQDAGGTTGLDAADFLDPPTLAAVDGGLDHVTLVIVPEPDKLCDCLGSTARPDRSSTSASSSPSIWRSANEALSEPGLLSSHILQYEDDSSEDVPIRVILEGWDAVERSQTLPPLWKKLRRTDELQFSGCGRPERLAILRLMHRLLRYQAEPTADQYAKLPPWYLSRPSQSLPHSSAIDFFVWPGVRERFVFSQHQYCSDFFWTVFTDNFRFLWPFEFRDCYKRNLETGRYSLSPDFQTRIHEIGSWTMAPDFFQHFPEMFADIPVYQSIPASVPLWSPFGQPRHQQHQQNSGNEIGYIESSEDLLVPNLITYGRGTVVSPVASKH